MNKLKDSTGPSALDAALAQLLEKRFGQITRRSFLSGMTRRMISLSGVTLASQVFPYFVPEARADGTGVMCGNHGHYCNTGTCHGGYAGNKWSACCQIPISAPPCPTVFVCVSYQDFCGTRPTGWPSNCAGVRSGSDWCSGLGDYICTQTTPGASYTSSNDCFNNCGGARC